MARLARQKIAVLLERGQVGSDKSEKGKALEDLVCYLFGRIPGISVTQRNELNVFATEEIDVAFWNERRPHGLYFLPHVLLVEAKNWSSPVGSAEVAWFDRKLKDRGLDIGILVAARGVTGNANDQSAAHQIIAGSLREGRRIVLLTAHNITELGDTEMLILRLKTRLCELAVSGSVFP